MSTVTLRGEKINVGGTFLKKGSIAPEFTLVAKDLTNVYLSTFGSKRKIISIFPSIDTPTCSTSVRKFNDIASVLENVVILCVSGDLPFAQARFCGAEGIENVHTLSTFRSNSFKQVYGVDLIDGPLAGLCARAIIVLDTDNKVLYSELVPEISNEPNYDAAIAALE